MDLHSTAPWPYLPFSASPDSPLLPFPSVVSPLLSTKQVLSSTRVHRPSPDPLGRRWLSNSPLSSVHEPHSYPSDPCYFVPTFSISLAKYISSFHFNPYHNTFSLQSPLYNALSSNMIRMLKLAEVGWLVDEARSGPFWNPSGSSFRTGSSLRGVHAVRISTI